MDNTGYTIIIFLFLFVLMVIGYLANRKSTNYADFTLGGKEVKWYAIGTNMGTGLFGASSLMTSVFYARAVGLSSVWLIFFPTLIGIILLGTFMTRRVRNLDVNQDGVYSISEMISTQYGPKVRFVYVVIIVLSLIAMAVANSIAMAKVISFYSGIDRNVVIILSIIICAVFVMIAGFKGISATSLIQAVLMVFSIIAIAIGAVSAGGGLADIQAAAAEIPEYNDLFSSTFPLSAAIGWTLCMGFPCIVDQGMHQKIISCKTDKDAYKAVAVTIAVIVILYGCGTLAGYSSAAWNMEVPEEANSEFFITWASQALFHPAVTVVIALGFVAAINTTLASVLSAASFSISRDLVYYYHKDIPEEKLLKITKYSIVGVGAIAAVIAICIPDILTAMYLTGNIMAGGLTLPVFSIFFFKKVTSQGVFYSSLAGTAFVLIDFILRQVGMELPWPGEPISIIITFVLSTFVLIVVSAMTQKKTKEV